jgi:hypothetical protein
MLAGGEEGRVFVRELTAQRKMLPCIRSRRLTPLADGVTLDLAVYELGNTLWKSI